MSKHVKPLFAAALIALAAPLSAQVGSLSDGSIMEGQAAAPAAKPGEEVSSEKIGAWDLQCAKTGPEPRPCRMYQLLTDSEDTPVIEMTMYRLPEGAPAAAGATFVAPLNTLLTAQLAVAIDGVLVQRVPFTLCYEAGCVARMFMSPIEVQAFQNGKSSTVSLVPALAPDQVVSVEMKLDGLKASFEKANPVNQ
ncbi:MULTISPECIES: invasion associated locus B family protein [Shimia]|uniref:invasion associated locus B family protein n=1 Tax=Shimia TaxID=573139 RepID=UPI001FB1BDB8|nr:MULTISPECIES: invasion associated locus B family protein [Shimia]MDV4144235.1 invasion associated locus B family protein [Shimia sp. FJ5]